MTNGLHCDFGLVDDTLSFWQAFIQIALRHHTNRAVGLLFRLKKVLASLFSLSFGDHAVYRCLRICLKICCEGTLLGLPKISSCKPDHEFKFGSFGTFWLLLATKMCGYIPSGQM